MSGSSKLSTSQSSRGMTSTPACKGGFPFPAFDASAVTDVHGHLTVPSLKERIGKNLFLFVPSGFVDRYLWIVIYIMLCIWYLSSQYCDL